MMIDPATPGMLLPWRGMLVEDVRDFLTVVSVTVSRDLTDTIRFGSGHP